MNALTPDLDPAIASRTSGMVVIAAGGTGGHFFPAEALAAELIARGHPVALMTDARSGGLTSAVFQGQETFVLQGAGIAGRGLVRGAKAAFALARGTLAARRLIERLQPAIIVGFGGYPSVAPILATRFASPLGTSRRQRRRPAVLLHEQNAVLGRANRFLARFADQLALGMAPTRRLPSGVAAVHTGNPVRAAIQALAGAPYTPPAADGPINLLVTGGSLGARVFSDAVPAAVALLHPKLRARLRIVQQCRAEDLERVRAAYAALSVPAELSIFFPDIAQRLASAHFVIARAGASTVAEIAAVGRPALLVPLPGAIDGHQAHNALGIDATVLEQAEFDPSKGGKPKVLAEALGQALCHPELLAVQAHAVAAHGRAQAASDLADLVEQLIQKDQA